MTLQRRHLVISAAAALAAPTLALAQAGRSAWSCPTRRAARST
jgi:hypothetical protein